MTESDWLLLKNVDELDAELSLVNQPRKLYLFLAACYRRVWDALPNDRVRLAVETTEDFANGRATARDLLECWSQAEAATGEYVWRWGDAGCPCCEHPDDMLDGELIHPQVESFLRLPSQLASRAAFHAVELASQGGATTDAHTRRFLERAEQFAVYRDVVGDPLERPVPPPPWGRDAAEVRRLLGALSNTEDPDPMCMLALADALEEAGCDDDRLLRHCRARLPHFRGCWAIEYLSGRSARA